MSWNSSNIGHNMMRTSYGLMNVCLSVTRARISLAPLASSINSCPVVSKTCFPMDRVGVWNIYSCNGPQYNLPPVFDKNVDVLLNCTKGAGHRHQTVKAFPKSCGKCPSPSHHTMPSPYMLYRLKTRHNKSQLLAFEQPVWSNWSYMVKSASQVSNPASQQST